MNAFNPAARHHCTYVPPIQVIPRLDDPTSAYLKTISLRLYSNLKPKWASIAFKVSKMFRVVDATSYNFTWVESKLQRSKIKEGKYVSPAMWAQASKVTSDFCPRCSIGSFVWIFIFLVKRNPNVFQDWDDKKTATAAAAEAQTHLDIVPLGKRRH